MRLTAESAEMKGEGKKISKSHTLQASHKSGATRASSLLCEGVGCTSWCVVEFSNRDALTNKSRIELLSAGGYRMDGRKPLEFRSMELVMSPHTAATTSLVVSSTAAAVRPDGSAQVKQGLTSVLACIYGPRESSRVGRVPTVRQDRANVHVEIAIAPWGGNERRYRARGDRYVVQSGVDFVR